MQIEYDYSKLKGRIVEIFGSQKMLAEALNISERTVSLKMNKAVPFNQHDIVLWCKELGIPSNEIQLYFFTEKVQ